MAKTSAYADIDTELKQAKELISGIVDHGNRNPRTQMITYPNLIAWGLAYLKHHSEYADTILAYEAFADEDEKKLLKAIDTSTPMK